MQPKQIYTVQRNYFAFHGEEFKSLKFIGNPISIVLRAILVLSFIVAGFTVITSNTDILGMRSYTVLTGSMEPTIPTGSIIYTMKNLGYNVGDIITFKNASDKLVTHRVFTIQNKGEVVYITKGDANRTPDADYITGDKIVGKTYFSVPFIGQIGSLLKTPTGLIAVVFIPSLIIILFELWNIKKEIEKGVERRLLKQLEAQRGVPPHAPWPSFIS